MKAKTKLSAWVYFIQNLRKGFQYALWFVGVGTLMGALYGLIAGIVLQPAAFMLAFLCVLVSANFVIALLTFIVHLILAIFKKGSRSLIRYFALSLSFFLVFFAVHCLLFATGMNIF
ncbi:MAG: PepSY protein [Cytophagaceae bacterium]|jgi:hypothetical protein|nr:PepSY protein [Cytophagaceae bacterium]